MHFSILIVFYLSNFQTAQPCLAVGRYTIVMEQIPLTLIFTDTVMCCPTYNRLQKFVLVNERSVWVISYGITQEMTVARGIREIILSLVFMHP